jgi:hypothetical protein
MAMNSSLPSAVLPFQHILELPFDVYQRYRFLRDIVSRLDLHEPSILEIGGSGAELRGFFPAHFCISADLHNHGHLPHPARGFLSAQGCDLPFRGDSFDITLSLDTLEHLHPDQRPIFLEEMSRTARSIVILASPFQDVKITEMEELIRDFWKGCPDAASPYLEEHLKYGLPHLQETAEAFAAMGWRVAVLPNGFLERWLLMMILGGIVRSDPVLKEFYPSINRLYNRYYFPRDNREPSYRHFVVCVDESNASKLQALENLNYSGLMNSAERCGARSRSEMHGSIDRADGENSDEGYTTYGVAAERDLPGMIAILLELRRMQALREKEERIAALEGEIARLEERTKEKTEEVSFLKNHVQNLEQSISEYRRLVSDLERFKDRIQRLLPYKIYKLFT